MNCLFCQKALIIDEQATGSFSHKCLDCDAYHYTENGKLTGYNIFYTIGNTRFMLFF